MARVAWPPSEHDQQVAERRRGRVAGMVAFLEEGRSPPSRPPPLVESQPVPQAPPPQPVAVKPPEVVARLKSLLSRMRGQ